MMVLVMEIWSMDVGMDRRLVPMPMAVRFAQGIIGAVRMLVVLVVDVQMFVLKQRVRMLVFVPFTQVQPDSDGHQEQGGPEQPRRRLAQQDQRERHP